jgi:hypothetical protein
MPDLGLCGEFSDKISAIITSYSDISNSYEQENTLLKDKLR